MTFASTLTLGMLIGVFLVYVFQGIVDVARHKQKERIKEAVREVQEVN